MYSTVLELDDKFSKQKLIELKYYIIVPSVKYLTGKGTWITPTGKFCPL